MFRFPPISLGAFSRLDDFGLEVFQRRRDAAALARQSRLFTARHHVLLPATGNQSPAILMLHPVSRGPYGGRRRARDHLARHPIERAVIVGPITGLPDFLARIGRFRRFFIFRRRRRNRGQLRVFSGSCSANITRWQDGYTIACGQDA
jgi:hypothetical protein